MSKAKNKLRRYKNIYLKLSNWKSYLLRKLIGFEKDFIFRVNNFGNIRVSKKMFGPFRENFFDEIYYLNFPNLKLKNNPTIIDVGANVGFFSLATFIKYPNAKIYAFEPHPYCYEILNNYRKTHDKFSLNIYNVALSDKEENIPIYTKNVNEFVTVSSVNNNNPKDQVFNAKAKKLGSFIDDEGIDEIDFMKLDCEGAEYSILYSLPKRIFNKISNICLETHQGNLNNHNLDSLNNYLQKQGYKTSTMIEDEYVGYIWAWKN